MEGLMFSTLQDVKGRRPPARSNARGEHGAVSDTALTLTRSLSPLPPRHDSNSRASTEATPRPSRHFPMGSLGSSSSQNSGATPTPSASALKRAVQTIAAAASEHSHSHGPHKIAALLGSSSSRGAGVPVMQNSNHPSRAHSRSETTYPNNLSVNNNNNSSMASSTTATSLATTPVRTTKALPGGPSPSNVSARGYDPGTFKPFGSSPALLAPSASGTPGGTGGGPSGGQNSSGSGSGSDDPWRALCVHVLPLFNREPLRMPYEDLNGLVRKHIGVVLSRHPSKAIQHLEKDLSQLLTSGMVTLNSKLSAGVEEEKLVLRVVELWGFFWDQVLPYVEAIFLPLQTDPYLASLNRGKGPRAPSPTHTDEHHGSTPFSAPGTHNIDVRHLALRAFRDSIVAPIASRLQARLSLPMKDRDATEVSDHHQPRLEQMLLVLSSIATQRYTHALSVSASNSQSSSERAISTLLRLVLYPSATATQQQMTNNGHQVARLPSFLSGGGPRDRRGRVARKSLHLKVKALLAGTEKSPDEDDDAREREREAILKSLKSPDVDHAPPSAFALMAAEGPGGGMEKLPVVPGIMVNQATPAQTHEGHVDLEGSGGEEEDEDEDEDEEEDEDDDDDEEEGDKDRRLLRDKDDVDDELDISSMSSVGDVLNGGNGILGRAAAADGAGAGGVDNMDTWEDAQAVVERMVGMRP